WRLLTVLAARVTGLDAAGRGGVESWHARREQLLNVGAFDPNMIDTYFERYRDRFDLFQPQRPWLQDPRLAEECLKSSGLNKLVMSRPAGNNQPWFLHHHDQMLAPIPAEEAVLHLIAQLYYGPSGRCTSRTVGGRSEANTTAGPLRSVVSFHPVGAHVFESLVAGIPYPGRGGKGVDAAPWELDELPDPLGVPPVPEGVGGILAGRFRHALLLTPGPDGRSVVDARITWAWREPHPIKEDPYLVVQTNKQGELYARQASADRGLWRDLDSLLLEDVGIEHRTRPRVLDEAQHLPDELLDRLRVRAFGFDQDGQTRNKQWYCATTPPVLDLLRDDAASAGVSRTREAAERAERHLRGALRTAWTAINDPSNGNGKPARKEIGTGRWPATAAARYWPLAEASFWRRVRTRDFDDPANEFVKLALEVFDQVTEQAGVRPRARRAVERARGYIFQALNSSKVGKTS
ncbi:MAG: CRISPR-associated protein Cse1 family, partial [Gemmatimonadales bacterium]|nr:CRISPR-associated protein Cse1 family [Gemmatimonadales bacterium]